MSLLTIADVRARCTIDPMTHCWLWRGAKSGGHPRIYTFDHERVEKRTMSGTLAMWNIAHGASPRPGHFVFRGCQHRACLNPAHLRQARDKAEIGLHVRRMGIRKGTSLEARRANIALANAATGIVPTPDDVVRQIRAATGKLIDIAARFDVAHQTVSRIRRRETRAGVT